MDPAEANPIQNWSETEGRSALCSALFLQSLAVEFPVCRFALLVLVRVPAEPAPMGMRGGLSSAFSAPTNLLPPSLEIRAAPAYRAALRCCENQDA